MLRELFVSGGYAEHSKVPPKITGRFSAPVSEIRTGNSHPSNEVETYCDKKEKKKKLRKIGYAEWQINYNVMLQMERHTVRRPYIIIDLVIASISRKTALDFEKINQHI